MKVTQNDVNVEQEMNNTNTSSIAQTRNSPNHYSKTFILKVVNDMSGIFKNGIKCIGHIR